MELLRHLNSQKKPRPKRGFCHLTPTNEATSSLCICNGAGQSYLEKLLPNCSFSSFRFYLHPFPPPPSPPHRHLSSQRLFLWHHQHRPHRPPISDFRLLVCLPPLALAIRAKKSTDSCIGCTASLHDNSHASVRSCRIQLWHQPFALSFRRDPQPDRHPSQRKKEEEGKKKKLPRGRASLYVPLAPH